MLRSSLQFRTDMMNMMMTLRRFLFGLAATAACMTAAQAQVPSGTGERLAKEAMALIAFVEMGNIGARDPECRGTPFPVSDIGAVVDREVSPILQSLAKAEKKSDPAGLAAIVSSLKQLPLQKDGGVGVIQRLYDQKKQEARSAYGAGGVCASVSSMVQTVMQQKRLGLREVSALVDRTRPN